MWSKTVTNMWGVICPLDECQKCKDGKLSNSNLIIQDQGESGDIVLHFCLSLFSYRRETRERSCKFKMLNQSSCDQCPKTFAGTSGLFYHRKGHTGEKKHKCDQCEKSFSVASSLKSHLRTHAGEKLQKCRQCNYSTNHVSNLRLHIMIHTGEKPHQCNQCEFSSANF